VRHPAGVERALAALCVALAFPAEAAPPALDERAAREVPRQQEHDRALRQRYWIHSHLI
jgi:hypothetical protein